MKVMREGERARLRTTAKVMAVLGGSAEISSCHTGKALLPYEEGVAAIWGKALA